MNHWFKLLRPEDNRLAMRLSKAYIVAIGNLVLPHPSGMIVFRIVAALRSLVLLHTNPVKNNSQSLTFKSTGRKTREKNKTVVVVIMNLWPVILLSIYFHLPHRISDPAGMSGGLPSRPRSSSSSVILITKLLLASAIGSPSVSSPFPVFQTDSSIHSQRS